MDWRKGLSYNKFRMTVLTDSPPQEWVADLDFERIGPFRRALKQYLIHPFSNHFPAAAIRTALRLLGSELAHANWTDPGGWQSMVISYQDRRKRLADKLLCTLGTIPMALRNRRRLAARVLARLIDAHDADTPHVLCLGAGPGHIINDALRQARRSAHATLVDLSAGACEYGKRLARSNGHGERMRFIQGDILDVHRMLDRPPDIVKMLGICEYIPDAPLTAIVRTVADVMPLGSTIVFNSLSDTHGTDRFFRRVFGLHMIHRSPDQLQALMGPAGFGDFVALPEPLGVYHVVIGHRTCSA